MANRLASIYFAVSVVIAAIGGMIDPAAAAANLQAPSCAALGGPGETFVLLSRFVDATNPSTTFSNCVVTWSILFNVSQLNGSFAATIILSDFTLSDKGSIAVIGEPNVVLPSGVALDGPAIVGLAMVFKDSAANVAAEHDASSSHVVSFLAQYIVDSSISILGSSIVIAPPASSPGGFATAACFVWDGPASAITVVGSTITVNATADSSNSMLGSLASLLGSLASLLTGSHRSSITTGSYCAAGIVYHSVPSSMHPASLQSTVNCTTINIIGDSSVTVLTTSPTDVVAGAGVSVLSTLLATGVTMSAQGALLAGPNVTVVAAFGSRYVTAGGIVAAAYATDGTAVSTNIYQVSLSASLTATLSCAISAGFSEIASTAVASLGIAIVGEVLPQPPSLLRRHARALMMPVPTVTFLPISIVNVSIELILEGVVTAVNPTYFQSSDISRGCVAIAVAAGIAVSNELPPPASPSCSVELHNTTFVAASISNKASATSIGDGTGTNGGVAAVAALGVAVRTVCGNVTLDTALVNAADDAIVNGHSTDDGCVAAGGFAIHSGPTLRSLVLTNVAVHTISTIALIKFVPDLSQLASQMGGGNGGLSITAAATLGSVNGLCAHGGAVAALGLALFVTSDGSAGVAEITMFDVNMTAAGVGHSVKATSECPATVFPAIAAVGVALNVAAGSTFTAGRMHVRIVATADMLPSPGPQLLQRSFFQLALEPPSQVTLVACGAWGGNAACGGVGVAIVGTTIFTADDAMATAVTLLDVRVFALGALIGRSPWLPAATSPDLANAVGDAGTTIVVNASMRLASPPPPSQPFPAITTAVGIAVVALYGPLSVLLGDANVIAQNATVWAICATGDSTFATAVSIAKLSSPNVWPMLETTIDGDVVIAAEDTQILSIGGTASLGAAIVVMGTVSGDTGTMAEAYRTLRVSLHSSFVYAISEATGGSAVAGSIWVSMSTVAPVNFTVVAGLSNVTAAFAPSMVSPTLCACLATVATMGVQAPMFAVVVIVQCSALIDVPKHNVTQSTSWIAVATSLPPAVGLYSVTQLMNSTVKSPLIFSAPFNTTSLPSVPLWDEGTKAWLGGPLDGGMSAWPASTVYGSTLVGANIGWSAYVPSWSATPFCGNLCFVICASPPIDAAVINASFPVSANSCDLSMAAQLKNASTARLNAMRQVALSVGAAAVAAFDDAVSGWIGVIAAGLTNAGSVTAGACSVELIPVTSTTQTTTAGSVAVTSTTTTFTTTATTTTTIVSSSSAPTGSSSVSIATTLATSSAIPPPLSTIPPVSTSANPNITVSTSEVTSAQAVTNATGPFDGSNNTSTEQSTTATTVIVSSSDNATSTGVTTTTMIASASTSSARDVSTTSNPPPSNSSASGTADIVTTVGPTNTETPSSSSVSSTMGEHNVTTSPTTITTTATMLTSATGPAADTTTAMNATNGLVTSVVQTGTATAANSTNQTAAPVVTIVVSTAPVATTSSGMATSMPNANASTSAPPQSTPSATAATMATSALATTPGSNTTTLLRSTTSIPTPLTSTTATMSPNASASACTSMLLCHAAGTVSATWDETSHACVCACVSQRWTGPACDTCAAAFTGSDCTACANASLPPPDCGVVFGAATNGSPSSASALIAGSTIGAIIGALLLFLLVFLVLRRTRVAFANVDLPFFGDAGRYTNRFNIAADHELLSVSTKRATVADEDPTGGAEELQMAMLGPEQTAFVDPRVHDL